MTWLNLSTEDRLTTLNNAYKQVGLLPKSIEKDWWERGVDYSTHRPSQVNFVPENEVIDLWKDDYESMRKNMIYGKSLPFDELIDRIKELKKRFRSIK